MAEFKGIVEDPAEEQPWTFHLTPKPAPPQTPGADESEDQERSSEPSNNKPDAASEGAR